MWLSQSMEQGVKRLPLSWRGDFSVCMLISSSPDLRGRVSASWVLGKLQGDVERLLRLPRRSLLDDRMGCGHGQLMVPRRSCDSRGIGEVGPASLQVPPGPGTDALVLCPHSGQGACAAQHRGSSSAPHLCTTFAILPLQDS